jgi:L-seryl-tRNA(Ser) seleniumtransferase
MSVYAGLGIQPFINAQGTLTRHGGSIMAPAVMAAMADAAQHFVDLDEAHEKVGARIAEMLEVPAAHVCAGASAGLLLATAACLAGTEPARIAALPDGAGARGEVILHRSHRNEYDQALRAAGAVLVEIGGAKGTHAWELETAISERTAAVVLFAEFAGPASLSVAEVARIARRQAVPVIVDAAAELPPTENFRRFLADGADLAIFSGGKDIRGPQTTGLVIGRADLIRAIARNASPNAGVGRSAKVGKEELAGFLRALEMYLAEDHDARLREWEAQVAVILAALEGVAGIRAWRQAPGCDGVRPAFVPRVHVEPTDEEPHAWRTRLVGRLRSGDPAIVVGTWVGGVAVNPHTLRPGEERLVAAALRAALTAG